MSETLKTFKHSGALGDIIYSLPTIKNLGGGNLYLDTTGGIGDIHCQRQLHGSTTKFDKNSFEFLYDLLKNQKYLNDIVVWEDQKIDYNLNEFRSMYNKPNTRSKTNNIVDLHLQSFNLDSINENEGWIDCGPAINIDKKIIISRSPRMQSSYPWFHSNRHFFSKNAVFVGLEKEHDLFEWTFDVKIEFFKVKNALELCKIIKGCHQFIANSTFTLSLAIGLGDINIIQELDKKEKTSYFPNKMNMLYV